MKLSFLIILWVGISLGADLTCFVRLTPSGSFEAKTDHVTGRIVFKGSKLSSKRIIVPVDSLKTGIDLRDEHLKKHLRFKKYPHVSLTDLTGENGKASAFIEIAGVKKKIDKINYSLDVKKLNADFVINTDNFNLDKVKYFNIGVDNKVKVNILIDVDKK